MAAETHYVYRLDAVLSDAQSQMIRMGVHLRRQDATGSATDASIQTFGDRFKEAVRGLLSNTATYERYELTQVAGPGVDYSTITCQQSGGEFRVFTPTGTVIGADSTGGEPLPSKDCMVVTLTTGLRGRSFRGRVYMSPMTEARQNAGLWVPAHPAAAAAAWATFLGFYGAGGTDTTLRLVTFSRVIASGCKADPNSRHHPLVHVQAGDQGGATASVSGATVRSVVYSQRSRTVGKGL